MLRFLHILVAWVLLLSTSGVTITAFYCQNQISGISLIASETSCTGENKCCAKNKEEHKKCCDSNSEFVQIDIDQISSYSSAGHQVQDIHIPYVNHYIDATADEIDTTIDVYALYNRPPPLDQGYHILYQRFLC